MLRFRSVFLLFASLVLFALNMHAPMQRSLNLFEALLPRPVEAMHPATITNQWYSSLTSGDMNGLAVSSQHPMTAYVSGYAGVWKTTNGGSSWALASSGIPTPYDVNSISNAFDNDLILYATHYLFGIFKSVDGGNSWQQIYSSPPGTIQGASALAPSNHNVFYFNTYTGGFRTSDGGSTWQPFNCLGYVTAVDPLFPNTAYFVEFPFNNSTSGVLKTTDGGQTCNQVNTIPMLTVRSELGSGRRLYGLKQYPHVLYYSDDLGVTWIPTAGVGFVNTDVWGFAIDPANRNHLLISSTNNGIRESRDAGGSWIPINNGYPIGLERNVIVGFNNPPTYYASTHGDGVWQYNSSIPNVPTPTPTSSRPTDVPEANAAVLSSVGLGALVLWFVWQRARRPDCTR